MYIESYPSPEGAAGVFVRKCLMPIITGDGESSRQVLWPLDDTNQG